MSKPKRSRAAGNLIRLDAGKKDHTTPSMPTPPAPAPLMACLKVRVAMAPGYAPLWVEVANYPADGGLEAFYDLIHRAPDDCFMTADASASISFASIVAIGRPKDTGDEYPVRVCPSPPGAPRLHYERLRVPIALGRGEIVEVANVPWTENGIAHFARVLGKHRRCDFVTTDFGFVPVRGVKLEDLRMPGESVEPKSSRILPADVASLDDFTE